MAAEGSIFDLGYARYEGARLGRPAALRALFAYSLRAAFGLGRGIGSKIGPMGLALVVAVPALIQIAVSGLFRGEAEVIRAEDYYSYVRTILAVFVAVVAPDLLMRDVRSNTIVLYFARPLERTDYALVKLGTLATCLLLLTIGPQLLLFIGNALASPSIGEFLREEWDQLFPIIVSACVTALVLAGVGGAIAVQTTRRVFAAVGILAFFLLAATFAVVIAETVDAEGADYALLASPFHLMSGATTWIFRAQPEGEIARAALPGSLYFAAALLWAAAGAAIVLRRFRSLKV